MRHATDLTRLRRFMRTLGSQARDSARVYFTGGATAVLHGWRDTTIDIDVKFAPERDELFRAVRDMKEQLSINVELAFPPEGRRSPSTPLGTTVSPPTPPPAAA